MSDTKKPADADLMKQLIEILAEANRKAIPEGMAMAEMARQKANAGPPPRNLSRCHKCGQAVAGCGGPDDATSDPKTGEDKNHDFRVVLPNDPDAARHFQGVIMNGVTYISNDHSHKILVPRANNIDSMLFGINGFERNERDMRQGKSRMHHSGGIGNGAPGFRPVNATDGWRF